MKHAAEMANAGMNTTIASMRKEAYWRLSEITFSVPARIVVPQIQRCQTIVRTAVAAAKLKHSMIMWPVGCNKKTGDVAAFMA